MTAPDTHDTTQLWREALNIMGYKVTPHNGYYTVEVPRGEYHVDVHQLRDEWRMFGLAVEWIEARGGKTLHHTPFQPDMSGLPIAFGVSHSRLQPHTQYARGRTLPTAAARWIVEHGRKLEGKEEVR